MSVDLNKQPERLKPFATVENLPVIPPPLPPTILPFYVVSEKKFWVLFIATFSLYLIYWYYRQWQTWKSATGEKIFPIARTIFSVFYTHALFQRIFDRAKSVDRTIPQTGSLNTAATIAVLGMFINNFIDKLTGDDTSLVWLILTLIFFGVTGWGISKAQHYANIACYDPQGTQNSKLTGLNYVWITIGGIFWLLIIVAVVAQSLKII